MAINNKKYLLLAIIFFGFLPFLYSQNAGYFIQENGDEVKYIQRFAWSGGEYARYYEVAFEKETDGEYKPYLKQTTTKQFVELSLSPGNYRFRVTPYDVLGKPAKSSSWVNVQILAVPQPEQGQENELENQPEIQLVFDNKPETESENKLEPEKMETGKPDKLAETDKPGNG